MSGEEMRGASAVFVADGTGLAHEYTGGFPPTAAYDMGNLDYHREMIPGYEAGMFMGHGAENLYAGHYADPSAYHAATTHAAYPQAVVSCGYPAFTPQTLVSHEGYPTLESHTRSDSRDGIIMGPNGKPKRRRVATIAQRRAANIRERRRMFNLNEAFDLLRKRVPTFAYEKRLSRIETLRLAITYISFMGDIVDGKNPKDIKLLSTKGVGSGSWGLGVRKDDGDEDDMDDEEKKSDDGEIPTQALSPAGSDPDVKSEGTSQEWSVDVNILAPSLQWLTSLRKWAQLSLNHHWNSTAV